MNSITYGFFGEDEPQRLFLDGYLQQLPLYIGRPEINFYASEGFRNTLGAGSNNKDRVDGFFVEAGIRGFLHYSLNLYFVGRDCDHHNDADCTKKRQELESRMDPQWQSRTIVFVPIQCIEHWLWYLKWNRENPGVTKNVTLENQSNAEAKLAVYGNKKATLKRSQPIVEDLTKDMDIQWLESKSPSFLAFHKRTESCVNTLLT